jgi:hypothetical protein
MSVMTEIVLWLLGALLVLLGLCLIFDRDTQ